MRLGMQQRVHPAHAPIRPRIARPIQRGRVHIKRAIGLRSVQQRQNRSTRRAQRPRRRPLILQHIQTDLAIAPRDIGMKDLGAELDDGRLGRVGRRDVYSELEDARCVGTRGGAAEHGDPLGEVLALDVPGAQLDQIWVGRRAPGGVGQQAELARRGLVFFE